MRFMARELHYRPRLHNVAMSRVGRGPRSDSSGGFDAPSCPRWLPYAVPGPRTSFPSSPIAMLGPSCCN
uniref:Uncharacterized protein n=1 Tax=Strigamia maritima TaxID=126957 RepID=T1JEZ6_STRMM